ncbi:MAG: hypothetical protein ABI831_08610 [Betaproteobacteria bacterium]
MPFDELRRPLFLVAVALIAAVFLIEVGGSAFVNQHAKALGSALSQPRPGYAIPFLAAIDGLLLYSMILMTISLLGSREVSGRLQGLVGLVISLLALLALFGMIFLAIQLLTLMVSLLLAPIFGTLAYLVMFGDFDRAAAGMTLSLVLMLKIGFAVCLVLAQQRFLQNKSLVTLVALSMVCTLLISFLHAFPPIFLVSITDIVAALVIAIIAFVWAIILLVGSVTAMVKAVV